MRGTSFFQKEVPTSKHNFCTIIQFFRIEHLTVLKPKQKNTPCFGTSWYQIAQEKVNFISVLFIQDSFIKFLLNSH